MRQRRRHGRVRCDDDQHTDHGNRDAVRDDAGVDRSNDDATNGAVHNPHDDDRHHDPHDELVDNLSTRHDHDATTKLHDVDDGSGVGAADDEAARTGRVRGGRGPRCGGSPPGA